MEKEKEIISWEEESDSEYSFADYSSEEEQGIEAQEYLDNNYPLNKRKEIIWK